MTWASWLFYAVFLGQIFLTSYYFPKQLLQRTSFLLENYPREDYPRLYPKPAEHYRIGQWVFALATRLIFVLGFVFLLGAAVVDGGSFADDGYISEAWPAAYGLIQFAPLAALELFTFSQLKLMRRSSANRVRRAELRPRRLLDYVSPVTLTITACLLLLGTLIDLWSKSFTIDLGQDTTQRILIYGGTNILLATVGAWTLYGRKQNPYQSSDDRDRGLNVALSALCYSSMAMSLFWIISIADELFGLDHLDAVLMSAYFQLIAYSTLGLTLRNLRPEDLDLEVYREQEASS